MHPIKNIRCIIHVNEKLQLKCHNLKLTSISSYLISVQNHPHMENKQPNKELHSNVYHLHKRLLQHPNFNSDFIHTNEKYVICIKYIIKVITEVQYATENDIRAILTLCE